MPKTMVGTPLDDTNESLFDLNKTLQAPSDADDDIHTRAGNDVVNALLGNDEIRGMDGNDTLIGDEGNDTLAGGAGDDLIVGGPGDDIYIGQDGSDSFIFEASIDGIPDHDIIRDYDPVTDVISIEGDSDGIATVSQKTVHSTITFAGGDTIKVLNTPQSTFDANNDGTVDQNVSFLQGSSTPEVANSPQPNVDSSNSPPADPNANLGQDVVDPTAFM